MLVRLADTIVAIASAPGGAARGILRLSGQHVAECLTACFRPDDGQLLAGARRPKAFPGTLLLTGGGVLPGVLYFWPTSRSYTREPAAEFHTLGSPPLLAAAVAALCSAGARLAEPGEFTLRAFLAGRLDLTQAEAVLGVIEAGGRAELNAALGQLAGGLAGPLANLRDRLLNLLAHLEAGLDFVDEDLEFISPAELHRQLADSLAAVDRLAGQVAARGAATPSASVVLAGWPNVGKSSLFNALLGRAAAIVSPRAGTTRDYLTERVQFDGLEFRLCDTAGLDPRAAGAVDEAAQSLRAREMAHADLILLCLDATRPLNAWERAQLENDSRRQMLVLTKCDAEANTDLALPAVRTSSLSGLGLQELTAAIRGRISAPSGGEAHVVASTADRCRESLSLAAAALRQALLAASESRGEELVAAEVRLALDELGKVAGAVHTDDVLDRIFSRFCIGK